MAKELDHERGAATAKSSVIAESLRTLITRADKIIALLEIIAETAIAHVEISVEAARKIKEVTSTRRGRAA